MEGAEKTWGELCLFSAAAPWQRRGGHKAKEFALCRFSISEGADGITGWGQGAPAPAGRVPTVGAGGALGISPLPLTQTSGDPGCFGILGQRLIAYRGQLDQYPQFPSLHPRLRGGTGLAPPCALTAGQARAGTSSRLRGSPMRGQRGHPQPFHPEGPERWSPGMGLAGQKPSGCSQGLPGSLCQLPAPCSPPWSPHSASPVPNPRVPIPVPERSPSRSGFHPQPLLPGLISIWSCWGRSLSAGEPEAPYRLLIRPAPPGPAESGRRNVAGGQAAPRRVSGAGAAAGVGVPGSGVPWHPRPHRWAPAQVAGADTLGGGRFGAR